MLKEVMLGSGGILLAAAIFASSVNVGPTPAGAPAAPVPPVVTPPPVSVSKPQIVTSPPVPIEDDSGDTQFGAPMITTTPVAEASPEAEPIVTDPDSAVGNGGRQYRAKGNVPHNFPIPK